MSYQVKKLNHQTGTLVDPLKLKTDSYNFITNSSFDISSKLHYSLKSQNSTLYELYW